ncbi:MAG: peptide ABC transporter substrate-binding protein [Chloroflexota bacterium]
MPRLHTALFLLFALLLFTVPASAQDGSGVVRVALTSRVDELTNLNPLLCNNELCRDVTDLMFSSFLHVDPSTGRHAPAGADDNALVTGWTVSEDGMVYTFAVRDDLQWSDGTPVSAIDAVYSLRAAIDEDLRSDYYRTIYDDLIVSITAPDDATVQVTFAEPTCRGLFWLDVPVVSSLAIDPTLGFLVDDEYDYTALRRNPYNLNPVTAGDYVIDEIRLPEFVRLNAVDSDRAYEFVYITGDLSETEALYRNRIDYVTDIADIENIAEYVANDVIVSDGLRSGVYALAMNLADPFNPRPFDTEDEGGQGIHPVFGDSRVREAVSLGVNVDEMIERAWFGYGTPVNSLAVPGTWYENAEIGTNTYDDDRARQLLNEAGWRDTNNNGVRECRTCETAPEGTLLRVRLLNPNENVRRNAVVFVVAQQLRRLGFEVEVIGASPNSQDYDMAVVFYTVGYPYDPERTFATFATERDLPNEFDSNFTSYSNPRVDELLTQASTQLCADVEAQAAAYREVQSIMAAELPVVPLFAPHRLHVASNRVRNFNPYPEDPLWNLTEWVVTNVEVRP